MKICKTCKYWNEIAKNNYYSDGVVFNVDPVSYEKIQPNFEVRLCKMPTQQFSNRPSENNGFALTDASEFFAVLATAERFGCVRHESK